MFFIHGGLFIFGAGDLYRPDYFMDEDVVLVTINYRLASFGFLNTGDELVRGNMGLKDQVLAMKFVQQNIRFFGGDPNRVTIFGESAGGASVHYHVLSPMSKGLFNKAISQSGLATNPWALTKDPVPQLKKFASNLGCYSENSKEMVSCMKNLTATEVVRGHHVVADPLRQLIDVFVPTVELNIPDGKTFLTDNAMNVLKTGVVNKVPMMTGANSEEGLINSALIARNESLRQNLRQRMETFLPRLLYLEDNTNTTVLSQLREYYYLEEPNADSLDELRNFTNMFTDRFWLTDLHRAVKYQSKLAPVYLYYYTYSGEFTLTDFVLALKGEHHPLVEILAMTLKNLVKKYLFWETLPNFGICHSDELSLQFYMPLLARISPSHRDYEMSREIVKLWVQFAKEEIDISGGTELSFLGQRWPPQDPDQPLTYFQLDTKPKLISEPNSDRIQFWNNLALAKHI
ncbi:unnamed protein product [Orchesella dallaii]|uniref:Carboxylic ester hydrolase n=1 Tax=Orchesella dallaii TaxID=48710 RepID=A0ABP1Q5U8_9HEXA